MCKFERFVQTLLSKDSLQDKGVTGIILTMYPAPELDRVLTWKYKKYFKNSTGLDKQFFQHKIVNIFLPISFSI